MAASSNEKKATARPFAIDLPALPTRGGTSASTNRHPIASGMSRETRRDIYDLDPKRITIAGYYVREDDESEEDFKSFREGIRLRGQIDVPISVRTTGPATDRQYILVWGRRRLRAARALGFPTIPVRDYGDLSETEAVKLQLSENLNRREMTPVECATAFWELSQRGISNREIVTLFSRAESYVSYMVRTGEALAKLSEDERRILNRDGLLYVRDCQTIAAIPSIAARVDSLQTLLKTRSNSPSQEHHNDTTAKPPAKSAGKTAVKLPPRQRPDEQQSFLSRELRNHGRSFRVRWGDEDLREAPDQFVAELTGFIDQELEQLAHRLDALEQEHQAAGGDAAQLDAIRRARADVASRIKQASGRREKTPGKAGRTK